MTKNQTDNMSGQKRKRHVCWHGGYRACLGFRLQGQVFELLGLRAQASPKWELTSAKLAACFLDVRIRSVLLYLHEELMRRGRLPALCGLQGGADVTTPESVLVPGSLRVI